jgi:hypothetical protein
MIHSGRRFLLLAALAVLLVACRGDDATNSAATATTTTGAAALAPTVPATALPAPTPTTALPPMVAATSDGATVTARPFHLPALAPGAPCPVTSWQPASNVDPAGEFSSPGVYNAFGRGPIYPIIYNFDIKRGAITFVKLAAGGPGGRQDKVLWIASPAYQGPALIRGRQLGGAGTLRFAPEDSSPTQLRFPVDTGIGSSDSVEGWRDRPSSMLIPSPGCYAFQIDGQSFSDVVVFQVSGVPVGMATAQSTG